MLTGLVASLSSAAQFHPFDRAEQIRGSDVIAIGEVESSQAGPSSSPPGMVTEASVVLDQVWKGTPESDHLLVRTPGGSVGGITIEVDGAATLHPGERVVLFLVRDGDGYRPWGMRFGKYRIEGGGDAPFAVGPLPPVTPEAGRWPDVSFSLDELREEVQAAGNLP